MEWYSMVQPYGGTWNAETLAYFLDGAVHNPTVVFC